MSAVDRRQPAGDGAALAGLEAGEDGSPAACYSPAKPSRPLEHQHRPQGLESLV